MRAISLFFLTAILALLPLKAEEQVYLMLFTSKTGHSAFPMTDTTHCEEEGEKTYRENRQDHRTDLTRIF